MGQSSINDQEVDYKKLLESFPGIYLILTPDFKIAYASKDYLTNFESGKESIVGNNISSILNTIFLTNNENITTSLTKSLETKVCDSITIKDIRYNKENDNYTNRLWDISNYPIISNQGEVLYIIHKLREVKETIKDSQKSSIDSIIDIEDELLTNTPDVVKEIKILLVDDREDNLFSLQEILKKDNYTIRTAKSGTEALKILLHEFDYTLIIMDVQMPVINGIETASMIYEREKLRHIPIIFITAADYSESLLFQGYETGGVDYIYKPIKSELLRAKVSVFVELYKKNHLLIAHEQRLRKAAELLKHKNTSLENSNSELEAFAYSVSHDLRAPLRAIEGYTSMISEDYSDKLDKNGLNNFTKIIENTRKMSHLINDLLNLSKVSRQELRKHQVDMENIINTVLIEFNNLFNKRTIDVNIHSIPPSRADENLIKQVWLNLISNAIKYTQQKDIAKIEIGAKEEEDQIIYYIKDNGIGFDMKYVDKVFAVFQRLHSDKDFEGTGIGLAIVNRIIQKHGGKIWVESKVKTGTIFYFSLPKPS